MKGTFLSTAEVLAEAIEKRDPYTEGHTRRVSEYSLAIAKYLSLSPSEGEDLRLAAILHDVGKIAVKDNILKKRGQLTEREFAAMLRNIPASARRSWRTSNNCARQYPESVLTRKGMTGWATRMG